MKRLTLLCLTNLITASVQINHVLESEVIKINDLNSFEANSKSTNVRIKNDKIILRGNNGEGSLINIKEEVSGDNWSIEFPIKHMILDDLEKTGFYVWYTNKPLESGSYLGGDAKFNGFITGIEFAKDRADIVFAFNYGLDFTNKVMQTMRFDHINPLLIENLESFKIKIIHTERNFKIELYDDLGHLISDSFRIHEPLIMNRGDHKKNFAITTRYENSPKELYFELEDLKINTREEGDEYDHKELNTEYNIYPRNKGDTALRSAIADAGHFLNYLTVALGSKDKNSIVEMVMEIKKKLRSLKEAVESKEFSENSQMNKTTNESIDMKLEGLDKLAIDMNNKLLAIKNKIKAIQARQSKKSKGSMIIVVGISSFILLVSVLRSIGERMLLPSKNSKKE